MRCVALGLAVSVSVLALVPESRAALTADGRARRTLTERSHCIATRAGDGSDVDLCAITPNESGAYLVRLGGPIDAPLSNPLGGLSPVYGMRASADSRYLALYHVAEGHPWIDIIDLAELLGSGKLVEIDVVDPYPGHVELVGWRGGALLVRSEMLLTHRRREPNSSTARVPSELMLETDALFRVSVPGGTVTTADPRLADPGTYFGRVLVRSGATIEARRAAIAALSTLRSPSSATFVRQALASPANAPVRKELMALLASVAAKSRP